MTIAAISALSMHTHSKTEGLLQALGLLAGLLLECMVDVKPSLSPMLLVSLGS